MEAPWGKRVGPGFRGWGEEMSVELWLLLSDLARICRCPSLGSRFRKGQRTAEEGGGGGAEEGLLFSALPSLSRPLGRGKPGRFLPFHDLIMAVHLWSAECVPGLDERAPGLCGSVVPASRRERRGGWGHTAGRASGGGRPLCSEVAGTRAGRKALALAFILGARTGRRRGSAGAAYVRGPRLRKQGGPRGTRLLGSPSLLCPLTTWTILPYMGL